jgi:hypothetical protein
MSDDIFELATPFNDVAELGQGYIDRADGDRILLSLGRQVEEGEAVRFIVHLADGTPAFAGAGRCVQVSDQGADVAPSDRYETLLDALAFDERSRPVYDYIVAVRQMAYAAEAEAGTSETPEDEAVYATGTSISAWPEAAPTEQMNQLPAQLPPAAELADSEAPAERYAPPTDPSPEPPADDATLSIAPEFLASVLPQPLPTGILKRPAIVAHWQPMAPRPPRPSSRPSRFRYPAGTLPAPSAPPRPDLHESQWVQPAIRP